MSGATDAMAPPGEVPVNGTIPCKQPLNSGFAGDELCIEPADPGTGLFIHVGPTDYADPVQLAEFSFPPGESTEYYDFNTTNADVVSFYAQHYRMRPGSHHLIMYMASGATYPKPGWGQGPDFTVGALPLGGTQRAKGDFPPGGVTPQEDVDLARPVPAHAGMSFELHFINQGEAPILREVWVNLMQTTSTNPQNLGELFLIGGGFKVPPGATQILNYTATLTEPDKRVVSVFGHRHANTDRFTVWAHTNGQRALVYEDYNWHEPTELSFNSAVQNPAPDPQAAATGGHSGLLMLKKGDALEWECEVKNTQSVTLTFQNALYLGEMCNLFGASALGGDLWYDRPTLVQK